MIKALIHDSILLARKSDKATIEDLQVAQDLLDTLTTHKNGCVGMAANMIGVHKHYQTIKVQWQTAEFQTCIKTYTGFHSHIIQHEVNNCNVVLKRLVFRGITNAIC